MSRKDFKKCLAGVKKGLNQALDCMGNFDLNVNSVENKECKSYEQLTRVSTGLAVMVQNVIDMVDEIDSQL